jgi:hypothetical protein
MSPPSSGSEKKPNRKAVLANCFNTGLLLGLFFDLQNGGDMFL